MSAPYWQYETSINPTLNISIRGDCRIPLHIYNDYIMEFIKTYERRIVKVGEMTIIHPFPNRSEYVTIISLKEFTPIDFPGHRR